MRYIKGQVLVRNNVWLKDAPVLAVPCDNINVVALYWMEPQVVGGFFRGYFPRLQAAKPTIDSVRALRVIDYNAGNDVWVAVADDADRNILQTYCDNCCDTVNGDTLPTVEIPVVITETTPCPDVDETTPVYSFFGLIPDNPNDFKLYIRASFNGEYPTPDFPTAGVTDAAAALAWVQANWAAYGDWTLENDDTQLKLASEDTISAGIEVSILDSLYCFAAPLTDITVDAIRIGGVTVDFPNGAVTFKSDTLEILENAILTILNGDKVIVDANTGGPRKLQYTGLQVPQSLYYNGVIVAGTTWTTGECPNIFEFAIPAQGNANNYLLPAATFDAVAGSPAPNAAGYATPALLLAFLTGSWSAYGTWTLIDSNTKVKLVSSTVDAVVMTITELPATYCMTVKAGPYDADGIMVDGAQVLFGAPVIAITNISYAGLRTAIAAAMPTATVTDAGSAKIQIVSKHIPTNLRLSNANVAAQTFALGAC